jgi:hypothetical protein
MEVILFHGRICFLLIASQQILNFIRSSITSLEPNKIFITSFIPEPPSDSYFVVAHEIAARASMASYRSVKSGEK